MSAMHSILWLTGNSGAGKTTLAQGLQVTFKEQKDHPLCGRVVVLDGDDMRRSISTEETMSAEDRRSHNLRVARLAAILRDQGFLVIVAVIAPFQKVRDEVDALCEPIWVYLKRSGLDASDRPYEAPAQASCCVEIDTSLQEETLQTVLAFLRLELSIP